MKKIFNDSVKEEFKCFCDKHPDKECFSELKAFSWYGSKFDMIGIEIHLCDECLNEMYDMLEKRFKIKPKAIEI